MIKRSKTVLSLATQADNPELLDLFKYPESSSLKYTMDRSPDYFSFCRIHDNWKVIVARAPQLTGAVTVTFSQVFLEKKERNIAYISDLRVDISSRKQGLGNSLLKEALVTCHYPEGKDIPVFACVFKDNSAGLKTFANLGRDNLAYFYNVADILAYFILPVSLKKPGRKAGEYTIRSASIEDLPEMLSLWKQVNSPKNLAGVLTEENFNKWLENVPDLSMSSYLLAIDKSNKIKGFLGLWNQSALRRITITSGSYFIKFIRIIWNLFKQITGFSSFPGPGQPLNFYNVFNLCVPETEGEILNLLIDHAFKIVKENNSLFLALALDKKDPLNMQLKGLIASKSEIGLLSNYNFNNNSTHNNSPFHLEISL